MIKMVKCEKCQNDGKYSFDGIIYLCNKCMIQALANSNPSIEISDIVLFK
jgi:hypothetical protein